jgi:hypothetical protein
LGYCQTRDAPDCVRGDEPSCACAPSRFGVFCLECSFSGYLNEFSECVCNARVQDPNFLPAPCTPIVTTSQEISLERVATNSTCECWFSRTKGMFRSSNPATKMGNPDPPCCDVCFSEGVGPPAGTVLDVFAYKRPVVCTRYGSANPSLVNATNDKASDAAWQVCSGHGTWNSQKFRCECDAQWQLRPTAYDGYYEKISTCDTCDEFWGPPGFCIVPWVPDPVTGLAAECGGHGTFSQGSRTCNCFGNSTAGHWEIATVQTNVTRYYFTAPLGGALGTFTALATQQACVECDASAPPGATPQAGCL